MPLEEPLVEALHRNGYRGPRSRVFIQSFEVANLRELRSMTRLPLVQLLNASGRPFDFEAAGDPRTYADLATPAGLSEIATYAQGVGPNKDLFVPRDTQGRLLELFFSLGVDAVFSDFPDTAVAARAGQVARGGRSRP